MTQLYLWPGSPPKKCEVCRKRLGRTLIFSDTTDGRRNISMCEACFGKVGSARATYGQARRYARISGMWVSGSDPDWDPERLSEGETITVSDSLSGQEKTFTFKKSQYK